MHSGADWALPEVTVIIAAWRAEAFLAGAVASALSQTDVGAEVILVDDASPDGTFVAAKMLANDDPRLRVVRLAQNQGPSGARNHALGLARGRWIAVLDADDAMVQGRLRRMIDLAEQTEADMVLGNLTEVVDGQSNGGFLDPAALPARVGTADWLQANKAATGVRTAGYLKPLIRADFLRRNAIRYDVQLRNGEDYHLVLACLLSGAEVRFDPRPDYLYSRREGSVSDRMSLDHLAALIATEDRLMPRFSGKTDLADLAAERRRALADLLTTEIVLRALKAGQVGRAGVALVTRPRAAAMVARQAGEGLRRRLGRARA